MSHIHAIQFMCPHVYTNLLLVDKQFVPGKQSCNKSLPPVKSKV